LIGGEVIVRPGEVADLAAIGEIQGQSGSAAQWEPREYLAYTLRVAERGGAVAGFLVARATAPDEWEILNVAVAPEHRRRGVAAALILGLRGEAPGDYFLEVRESNSGARALYEKLGFRAAGKRPGYYENPPEDAVVMRLQS
jgi:[ribosomal protein S18]-alanine N-acetyltransferase